MEFDIDQRKLPSQVVNFNNATPKNLYLQSKMKSIFKEIKIKNQKQNIIMLLM